MTRRTPGFAGRVHTPETRRLLSEQRRQAWADGVYANRAPFWRGPTITASQEAPPPFTILRCRCGMEFVTGPISARGPIACSLCRADAVERALAMRLAA